MAELEREAPRPRAAGDGLPRGRNPDADAPPPAAAADGGHRAAPGRGRRGDHRGEPRDGRPPGAVRAARHGRDTAVAGRAVVPAPPPGRARPRGDAGAVTRRLRVRPGRGVRGHRHRPAVRGPGPDARRPRGRHGRGARAGPGPRVLVRARAEARARRWPAAARRRPTRTSRRDAYHRIVEGLEEAGYRWYETANFARPGHECRHSLAYWDAADYLGMGVGAVSTVAGRRWRNSPGLARLHRGRRERARAAAHRASAWTPTTGGASGGCWACGWTARARPSPGPGRPTGRRRSSGFARPDCCGPTGTSIALTRRGRFVQNSILHELMEYA